MGSCIHFQSFQRANLALKSYFQSLIIPPVLNYYVPPGIIQVQPLALPFSLSLSTSLSDVLKTEILSVTVEGRSSKVVDAEWSKFFYNAIYCNYKFDKVAVGEEQRRKLNISA